MKELWVEKYRPKTVEDYVFRDDNQRNQVLTWIKEKSIPHLILSGSPGIGKTTLAKVLLNEIGVEEYDILVINASRDNGVEYLRDTIVTFVSMIPFGPFKVVLLDEADYLTHNAQAVLRGVMEEFHDTARFILTCNLKSKIMPALFSRSQGFDMVKTDQTEFTARVATILVTENVEFVLDTLDTIVKATYPDLRKCINLTQQSIVDNTLVLPGAGDAGQADYTVQMVNLFKAGDIQGARKLLCGTVRPEEMIEIYTWMYQNLDLFGKDDDQKDSALLIIKQALVDASIVADPEINLAACLVKLGRLQNQ